MIRKGLSEKVTSVVGLKNKKVQPCQEWKSHGHRENNKYQEKPWPVRGGVGKTSLTCWRKRKKESGTGRVMNDEVGGARSA